MASSSHLSVLLFVRPPHFWVPAHFKRNRWSSTLSLPDLWLGSFRTFANKPLVGLSRILIVTLIWGLHMFWWLIWLHSTQFPSFLHYDTLMAFFIKFSLHSADPDMTHVSAFSCWINYVGVCETLFLYHERVQSFENITTWITHWDSPKNHSMHRTCSSTFT